MRIYLDEDLSSGILCALLRNTGHDVATPADAGLIGESDAVQLTYAISETRVFLSRNYKDFEELHYLVGEAQGRHFGILVVRRDNDPSRDLTPKGIVTAIRKLEAASVPIANQYIIVNHWR